MGKHFMPQAIIVAAHMAMRPAGILGPIRNEANIDAAKLEKLLGEVKSELTRVGDDVKKTAEQALQQAKDAGKVSDEVKTSADKLLTAQAALNDAQKKLEGKIEQLETRNTDLEQKVASRRGSGGSDVVKSLGQQVAESEEVKNFASKMGAKGTIKITVNNVITSGAGSAADLISPQRDTEIVGIPRRQMTIRQLLSAGRTTTNSIEFARQLARTNNAAVVAENTQKAESNYTWELDDAPVRTIAHWVPVSRNAMDDIPQLQSEIDGELRYGLDLVEELEILKGDGTGQHIEMMIRTATATAEKHTGRVFLPTEFEWRTGGWCSDLRIPVVPIREITAINYLDPAHVEATALIDQRVYDDPPRTAEGLVTTASFPYVSFGPTQVLPDGWDCQDSSEIFFQLDAWSRKPGFAEVKKIAGAVRPALHKYDLPLAENALVSLEFVNTRILRDPDGKTSHAAMTFKAVVDHD